MTFASRFGFAGGAFARVALVTLYAGLAVSAILLVETRPLPTRPAAPAVVTSVRDTVEVSIESTYTVATWTVRYAGAAVPGESGPVRWRGRLALDANERQLVVEASPRDPLAADPCALRIAVRNASGFSEASTLWGSGFISGIVVLPGERKP